MRTPEVETAMQNAAKRSYALYPDEWKRSAELLAAEVERLEEQITSARASLRSSIPNDVAFARKRDYDAMEERAEAAEARVRELEAQYACKRHNGEEAPEAAAQLTDDMLRSCQICGLTVDISKGHCEPTIEFTMQGRTDKKTKKLAELEAQNARMRAALEDIAAYDVGSRHAGTCPYGCDTPAIAQNTLAAEAGRARAATKALADGKAAL